MYLSIFVCVHTNVSMYFSTFLHKFLFSVSMHVLHLYLCFKGWMARLTDRISMCTSAYILWCMFSSEACIN